MKISRVRLKDRILTALLAMFLLVGMIPTTAFASAEGYDGLYTISVKDTEGNAIAGATVNYAIAVESEEPSPAVSQSATSDSDGVVAINLAEYEEFISAETPATLTYTVEKEGYNTLTNQVNITSTTGDIVLSLETASAPLPPTQYTVSVSLTGDAVVELNGTEQTSITVEEGEEVSYEIVPGTGAYISSLLVDGGEIYVDKGQFYSGTITVTKDIDISATVITECNVTYSANEGGTVTLNGNADSAIVVDKDSPVTIAANANEGYQVASVSINGSEEPVGAASYSKEVSIAEDTTISVTFVQVFTVFVTHNENGIVTTDPTGENGTVIVESGNEVKINAIPSENYRVSQVVINGESDKNVSGGNSSDYNVTLVANQKYTVEITFSPNVHTVTVVATENGTVTPVSKHVNHVQGTRVDIVPNEGYTIESAKVNGNNVEIMKDETGFYFNIPGVTENQTVQVEFKALPKGSMDDVTFNTEDAVRVNADEQLYVFKKDEVVTFGTSRQGIKLFDAEGALIGGGTDVTTVDITETKEIAGIQLFYQGDGELVAMWHTVEMENINIVIDNEATVSTLGFVSEPNENDYFTSDVLLSATVQDGGYYSGIAKVEYWINGNEAESQVIYQYVDGEIISEYTNEQNIVVDADTYNSKDVVVTLKVTDRAGNVETVTKSVNINTTKPQVSLEMIGNKDINAAEGYYNAARTATITIIDREDTFSAENVLKGIKIYKNDSTELVVLEASAISWEHDGDTHTGTLYFKDDAKYKWELSYTNLAGLTNEGVTASGNDIYEFIVDQTAPTNLKITYLPEVADVFLENVTFGFYKDSVKVQVEAEDDVSGVETLTYSYIPTQGDGTGESDVVLSGDAISREGNKASASFTINTTFRGKVSVVAMNKAGGKSTLEDTKTIVVDNVAPGITVTYDNNEVSNSKYYNAARTATIKIDEDNFFEEDLVDRISPDSEETYLNISVEKKQPDGTFVPVATSVAFAETEQGSGIYEADISFAEDGHYKFSVDYTDRSGNVSTYGPDEFIIDKAAPGIEVKHYNNDAKNNNNFQNNRKIDIIITEDNFDASGVVSTIKWNRVALTAYNEYLQDNANWTQVGSVHTATIELTAEGNYTFDIAYTDLSGRVNADVNYGESVAPTEFTIDKTVPTDLKVTYAQPLLDTILQGLSFGFYQAPIKVTLEAKDSLTGIDYFTYSYAVQENESDTNSGLSNQVIDLDTEASETASASFSIPSQFRGKVSFIATDKAGNDVEYLEDGKIVVADNVAPVIEVTYDNNDVRNENCYKDPRTATVKITEANFFPEDLVDYMPETEETYLAITAEKQQEDGSYAKIENTYEFVNTEQDVYVTQIPFEEDGQYRFDIKYTDRSGNESADYNMDEFVIDTTDPTDLKITIDEKSVVSQSQDSVVFDTFYSDAVTVKLAANDTLTGVESIKYQKVSSVAEYDSDDAWQDYNDEQGITVTPNEKFIIYMRVEDKAGNVVVIHSTGIVVDNKQPEGETMAPEIDIVLEESEPGANGFYKDNVTVSIAVKEPKFIGDESDVNGYYSGLKKVAYRIYTTDTDAEQTGTLLSVGELIAGASFDEDDLITSWSGTFEIDANQFNSNNVLVEVTAIDNALNERTSMTASGAIKIDVKAPVVGISYTNNNVSHQEYFKAAREAIITVSERNFVAGNVKVVVTKNGKEVPEFELTETDWVKTEGTGNLDNTKWTATLSYVEEGDYTFSIGASDLLGNVTEAINYGNSAAPTKFTIDKTRPQVSIAYDNLDAKNEKYYKASRKATITVVEHNFDASDFEFTCEARDITANKALVDLSAKGYTTYLKDKSKWNPVAGEADTWKTDILFDIEGNYVFDLKYADMAGNTQETDVVDDFCLDWNMKQDDSTVSVSYSNSTSIWNNFLEGMTFGFYKAPVKVTINAMDKYAGIDYFEYSYTVQDNVSDINTGKGKTTISGNSISVNSNNKAEATATFTIPAQFRGNVKVTSYDKAGNSRTFEDGKNMVVVDNIAPVIEVTYDNNAVNNQKYYNANRTATIKIKEANFFQKDLDEFIPNTTEEYLVITVGKTLLDGTYTETKMKPQFRSNGGDEYIAEVEFEEEAHYTFDIKYTDRSGNVNDSYVKDEFTIDKSVPTDLAITVANDNRLVNNNAADGSTSVAFDTFYAEPITVRLTANCDISGIGSLKYQKVNALTQYNENGKWEDYNSETGIVATPNDKFIIFFRAEDNAGNVSIVNSTGIVVDNMPPVGETRAPEIDINLASPGANGFYNDNVGVSIKVVDPKYIGDTPNDQGFYSGLAKVTYRISANNFNGAVSEGTLFDSSAPSGVIAEEDNLVHAWAGSTVIRADEFNSNNVVIAVTATDKAGNTRTTTTPVDQIKIDITSPLINVSYSNNAADSEYYFNEDRIATIVITERNFSESGVKLVLTNSDGSVPVLSNWSKTDGGGNGDNDKWTATLTYAEDGDYEFGIEYTDLAGNKAMEAQYGDSVAPIKFTIDKTQPEIDVTYDNNAVSNTNYYMDKRTATVTITERNLDPNGVDKERVVVTMSASNDGAAASVPVISSWTKNNDKHTATITYEADALYSFDIALTDKAGNTSEEFEQHSFYVDQKDPALEITGIEHHKAYNGDVMPVITYSDTNYDPEQVVIELSGANRGKVELDGSYENIHNGRVFTFSNFPVEKEFDDIYTLKASITDKAGRTKSEEMVFSVNRFGSTYDMSEETRAINGNWAKEPIDIVITEINPNKLEDLKLTLFKNNETIVLEEGKDYKVTISGGEGEWYVYTYTVFAENFVDDGAYRLSFHSVDEAGNIAENTLDTKATEISFGIDKTMPNVVVANLESGQFYAEDNKTVTISANDNMLLKSVVVYLDGKEYISWGAEELKAVIDANGELSFDISGDSTSAHNVKIICTDAAGNERIEEIKDFFVTTNRFVQFINNKPLLFGSIAGVILIIGFIELLVIYKRKKRA